MSPAPSAVRGLLFDLDGTLVDSDPLHHRTWRELLAPHGLDVDDDLYRTKFSGRLNPDIVEELLPQLDRASNLELCDRKEALFRALTPRLDPLPGVVGLLALARTCDMACAVVTNAPRLNADHMLAALGLADCWDAVIVAEEVGIGKPDPAPYREGLRRLGIDAGAAIAFEDSVSGVRAAAGAGIFCVGLTTTQDPAALRSAGAATIRAGLEGFDPRAPRGLMPAAR
ncbi:MAG: HAD family phosphatase [Alphaproteobacteria bacterium]|nr:HAD family phosphatase [Alphaproteobacteria bacterium]